jgi:phosphoribosylanthranilate isomerase
MDPILHPRLKVCCILSHEEAALAVCAGASALGLVSAMPSGPGVIEEEMIADIVRSVPPPVATFLLTSRQSVVEIVAQYKRVRTSTIQVVDTLTQGTYAELRDQLPGIKIVQVIHVSGPESVDEAAALCGEVDAILLDSGRPNQAVKELGGTGRRHDWSVSRRIREAVSIPIFLAGGLRSDNVREAIREVGPFGIDVCSGVRTNGRLDPRKLEDFVRELRGDGGRDALPTPS